VVGLAVLLGANRLLVPRVARKPRLFWAIQAVTAGLAVGIAAAGLPGLGAFPEVRWLVSGLLVFHVVQNLALRSALVRRAERDAFERELAEQLRRTETSE
jgi:hypothetical protein